jgi:cytochrome P450
MVGSVSEVVEYKKSLLAERRREPRDDFLGVLASAEAKEGSLREEEIFANAMLLLLAGHVAVKLDGRRRLPASHPPGPILQPTG